MNVGAAAVHLRARRLSEIIDLALRFTAELGSGLYLRLAAVTLLPAIALCLALRFALGLDWLIVWATALLCMALLEGPFTLAASRLMFSDQVGAGQILKDFARRLPSHLAALLVAGIFFGLGALLGIFIAPPILAALAIAHVPEVSLLEQAGPFTALRRSTRFVRGRAGETLAMQIALVGSALVFVGIAELLGTRGLLEFILQLGAPLGRLEWGGSAFAVAGLLCATPFVATLRFLVYVNGRTLQDGWDIQVRCLAINARHASTRAETEAA